MKRFILSILAVFVYAYFVAATPSFAVNFPDFPTCTNPRGDLLVKYDSGIHGIVGDTGSHNGSDSVYIVSDTQVLQCFCDAGGSGIQTNWWKQSSLDNGQADTLRKLGWIFVPSGTPWGLADTPYLAQNSNFSCGNVPGPTPTSVPVVTNNFSQPGPGSAPVCDSPKPVAPVLLSVSRHGISADLVWTKVDLADHYVIAYGLAPDNFIYGVPNTGNVTSFTVGSLDPNLNYYFSVRAVNNCMPSDPSNSGPVGGGQVLGLAATGNLGLIAVLLFGGAALLFLSLWAGSKRRV